MHDGVDDLDVQVALMIVRSVVIMTALTTVISEVCINGLNACDVRSRSPSWPWLTVRSMVSMMALRIVMSALSLITLKAVKSLVLWRDDEGPSVVTATCTLPDLTALISYLQVPAISM